VGIFFVSKSQIELCWRHEMEHQMKKTKTTFCASRNRLSLRILSETILIMTSKIFFSSKQKVLRHAIEVLSEMRLGHVKFDADQNRIIATRKWNLLNPKKEIEILLYSDDQKVEVAVNVESRVKMLDFGSNEYMEEEILIRLKEKLN
jgi:hypothetical protein